MVLDLRVGRAVVVWGCILEAAGVSDADRDIGHRPDCNGDQVHRAPKPAGGGMGAHLPQHGSALFSFRSRSPQHNAGGAGFGIGTIVVGPGYAGMGTVSGAGTYNYGRSLCLGYIGRDVPGNSYGGSAAAFYLKLRIDQPKLEI